MKKIKDYIKRILKLITLEEMQILPGHLAFNIVLMIVPIFSMIGVLGSNLGVSKLLGALEDNVPNAVLTIIESALNVESSGSLVLFIIFGIWLVSGGCRAIIAASDILYKIKDISILKSFIKSFLMVIILFMLISFMILVPVLGDFIFDFLDSYINERSFKFVLALYDFFKYPLSIILMFISIKFLYTLAPSVRIDSSYMNKGAWFTSVSWLLLTRIYSFHLNNYSNYNVYYGSLSNILILLLWVYLLAFLFTVGIALNANTYFIISKEKSENN